MALINDVLDISKIEAGRMELETQPFDVRECVESALDLVASKAREKRLELAYFIDAPTPPTVLGDVTRLRQILINLLGNSPEMDEYEGWIKKCHDAVMAVDPTRSVMIDGGGALMNQSIHMVDMLCDLMPPIESVQAYTATLGHNGGPHLARKKETIHARHKPGAIRQCLHFRGHAGKIGG